jgi:hypothetical protein
MEQRKVVLEREDGVEEFVYMRVVKRRKPVSYPDEVMYEKPIGPFL